MDEFLEKLQEDQRRMRKYLRAHALDFKKMGAVLAHARASGARVFVIGEPPLEGFMPVVAEDYLVHLPALHVDLTRPRPDSVDPEGSDELPAMGRQAAAKQAIRHLHADDVLLAFLVGGDDEETAAVLEGARARRVRVVAIGGLGAKSTGVRRTAAAFLALPTRGMKTICESVFLCARILARVSRAAVREAGEEEPRLVQVACDVCNEQVFFEERLRGKRASCPLCEANTRVAKDSERRVALLPAAAKGAAGATARPAGPGRSAARPEKGPQASPAGKPDPGERGRGRRRLKPSVLELPTLAAEDEDVASTASEPEPEPSVEAPVGLVSHEDDPGAGAVAVERRGSARDGGARGRSDGEPDGRSESKPRSKSDSKPRSKSDSKPSSKSGSRDKSRSASRNDSRPGGLSNSRANSQANTRPGEAHDGPSFGSDIVVGSSVVSVGPSSVEDDLRARSPSRTASADPFALEDGLLADLEMPAARGSIDKDTGDEDPGDSDAGRSGLEPSVARRMVSARYTIDECRLRWGRGGYPDDASPEHPLIALKTQRLEFYLNPDDEAGTTLQQNDELWVRLEIPAFIEPILVRGLLRSITGTLGVGPGGARVDLELREMSPAVRRNLERAAENLGAPA